MAVQYVNSAPSKDADISVKNGGVTFGHAVGSTGGTTSTGLTVGANAGLTSGGTTVTTERPTGGTLTQGGNAVGSQAAGGYYDGRQEGVTQRPAANTDRPSTQTATIYDLDFSGSTVSSSYSGSGGGSVVGNADAPKTVAVNPQQKNVADYSKYLPLLLLVPILMIIKNKK